MELFTPVAEQYRDFAASATDSPCFYEWASSVADDAELCEWIGTLPELKQQPNLVFAAARWNGVAAPGPYLGLREALLGDTGAIRSTIMSRSTQTNEVGRLACLLPVFSRIAAEAGRPLALLEVGCSAGLNLYPDAWSYEWTGPGFRWSSGPEERGDVSRPPAGVLPCRVTGLAPADLERVRVPEIGWRGGIDLNPLDVRDPDQMAWLLNLVWPEQHARRDRLRAAIASAEQTAAAAPGPPVRLVAGDLVAELPSLVAEAAEFGEVVVFHSAVIAYLDAAARTAYQTLIRSLVADRGCRWISNEGQRVLPEVTATLPVVPADPTRFVLALDGQALALTHGHGRELDWAREPSST